MTAFKAILFTVGKSVFQSEVHFLKRSVFYSATLNTTGNEDQLEQNFDDDSKLQQKSKKLVKVAMLGLPNVGKSTLVNKLTRRSVCPTSSKVHTTMHKAEAIYTERDTQIIFVDTPGLIKLSEMKTYKLSETFIKDPKDTLQEADVIGIVQDVSNIYTRHKFDNFVLDYLNTKREGVPLLLILNKIDKTRRKSALLGIVRVLTSKENYPKFDDVFMVSALTGDGIDDLRNYLLDSAKEKEWKYKEEFFTDQPIETIIEQTVRAKLMDTLPHEMPYKVKIQIEHCNFGDDSNLNCVVILDCPTNKYVSILLKKKAFKLKYLAFEAEKDLRYAFKTPVFIRLSVQCSDSLSK